MKQIIIITAMTMLGFMIWGSPEFKDLPPKKIYCSYDFVIQKYKCK